MVERRIHIVTGKKPSSKDVDHLIDTGESEAIFKTAIQKQGRGHVSAFNSTFNSIIFGVQQGANRGPTDIQSIQ